MGRATRPWLRHLDDTPLIRDLVARGHDWAQYQRWVEQIARTGHCTKPIRLAGKVRERDPASGAWVDVYSTACEPDGCAYTACGSRLESRCAPARGPTAATPTNWSSQG